MIFLNAYFAINIFAAGYNLAEMQSQRDPKNLQLFYTFGLILFAIPFGVLLVLYFSLESAWKWLDRKTTIPFWLGFYAGHFTWKGEDREERIASLKKTLEALKSAPPTKARSRTIKHFEIIIRHNEKDV